MIDFIKVKIAKIVQQGFFRVNITSFRFSNESSFPLQMVSETREKGVLCILTDW